MKKFLTTSLFILLSVSVFSQKPVMKRIDSMLINIDKPHFTTNILYERTTPWSKLNIFNDSINISTKRHFEQALHELYKASNEQKFTYYRDLRNQYTSKTIKNVVNIGIINTSFNELNYEASDEAKSALRIVNNKFEKIDNTIPIFKTKHALVISPLKEKLVGNTITYQFNSQFLFQETDKPIQTLVANFDTSQNYTIIENGTITTNSITVNYPQEGIKTLTFNVTFIDGTISTTSAIVQVTMLQNDSSLVETDTQIADTTFQGALGEIEYRIFYRTKQEDGSENINETTLKKPIVIIDGFDPGDERRIGYLDDDETDNTLINQMYYENDSGGLLNVVNELREEAYDVVLVNQITHTKNGVDIDGGADYIERNAMAHIALYQHLNTRVAQSGSTEQLVIMGPSMGGQISRYALAYMEKENIDHNTRLWVSIDSPHLGANIPVGQQAMMNLLDAFGDSVDAADFYNDRLKSVAGNQQLIEQHLPYHLPDHLNNGSPVRQQYMSNLTSNGLSGSDGYPQNLRKIAMANGSVMGTNVDVAGTEDFRIHGFVNQLWWNVLIAKMYTKYMPDTGDTKQVAAFWRALKPFRSATYTNINPNGSMDIVPGGLFDTQNQLHGAVMGDNPDIHSLNNGISLGNALSAYLGFYLLGLGSDYFESRTNKEIHSFVPTVSALGFKNSNFNWSDDINRNLVCTNEIPFDTYYAPQNNEDHTSFTQTSKEWLFEELAGNPQPPTVYLDANDLNGPNILCTNQTEVYYFDSCTVLGTVNWQVSSNIQLVSSSNSSVTIRSNYTNSTTGWIKASFNGLVLTKTIGINRNVNETPMSVSVFRPDNYTIDVEIHDGSGETPYYIYLNDVFQTTTNNSYISLPYNYSGGRVEIRNRNFCDTGWNYAYYTGYFGGSGYYNYTIFPNPVSEILTLERKEDSTIDYSKNLNFDINEKNRYELYNYNQILISKGQLNNLEKIDVSSFKSGIYILLIITEGVYESHRLIIK